MRKSTDTREKLLETAINLILQSNYYNVGVAEICQQAGVTKGSFYHYFDSKAELFYEAGKYDWENLKPQLDAICSPSFTPLQQLENILQFVIDRQTSIIDETTLLAGCPIFNSAAQCGCDEEIIRKAGMELSDNSIVYYSALVRNLKADGLLNGDPEPQQLGRMIQQYIQGLLTYGRLYQDLAGIEQDLREGVYRIVDLKQEYRQQAPAAKSKAEKVNAA